MPSHALNDGVDYVPSQKGMVFGHHFTSIAGTGPNSWACNWCNMGMAAGFNLGCLWFYFNGSGS